MALEGYLDTSSLPHANVLWKVKQEKQYGASGCERINYHVKRIAAQIDDEIVDFTGFATDFIRYTICKEDDDVIPFEDLVAEVALVLRAFGYTVKVEDKSAKAVLEISWTYP